MVLWFHDTTTSAGNSAHFPLSPWAPWRTPFKLFGKGILHRLQDTNNWIFSLPHSANILLLAARATGYADDNVITKLQH